MKGSYYERFSGDFWHDVARGPVFVTVRWCRCTSSEDGVPVQVDCECGKHKADLFWHPVVHHWEKGAPLEAVQHWRLRCLLEHLNIGTHNLKVN